MDARMPVADLVGRSNTQHAKLCTLPPLGSISVLQNTKASFNVLKLHNTQCAVCLSAV